MACNCIPNIIQTPPSNNPCENCLKVVSLRYSCTDGPSPCGDSLVVDLSEYNDVTACDCGSVVYSIKSFDTEAFSSVSVTSGGILTAVTSDNFVNREEALIVYKVDCPCNILSATGNIYVCKKNLCANVLCDAGYYCDQCDGECKEASSDLDIDNGNIISYTGGGTGFA